MNNTRNLESCATCAGTTDLIQLRHNAVVVIDGSIHAVPYRLCHNCFDTVQSETVLKGVETNYYSDNMPKPIEIKKMLSKLFRIRWKDISVTKGNYLEVTVPPRFVCRVEDWFTANAEKLSIPQNCNDMNEWHYQYHVGCDDDLLEELLQQAEEGEETVRHELQTK